MSKIRGQLESAQTRLGNENFVSKAPLEVIRAQRANVSNCEAQLAELKEQIETLKDLG